MSVPMPSPTRTSPESHIMNRGEPLRPISTRCESCLESQHSTIRLNFGRSEQVKGNCSTSFPDRPTRVGPVVRRVMRCSLPGTLFLLALISQASALASSRYVMELAIFWLNGGVRRSWDSRLRVLPRRLMSWYCQSCVFPDGVPTQTW